MTFDPGVVRPDPLVLVMPRSAVTGVIVVVAVDALLPGTPSGVVDVTFAVLVIVPLAALTVTTSVNVADAPEARVAIVAVSVAGPVITVKAGPLFCTIETKVVFAGTASVSETLCASAGPLFVKVSV